ncbi:hypothetical protein N7492_007759 [Penicillium capsulatum]|uniref:HMG box domain-containing protein n=1 Tax=Penicillium capsulatum TaxID=69766 RepID=A0A9W9I0F1_9EURO|nr:hypothetical protein N7492_007759 [Penicillium capsulatum]KAJ6117591.1 hypothetical protein N7512_007316 [Penicillium capsulatum]
MAQMQADELFKTEFYAQPIFKDKALEVIWWHSVKHLASFSNEIILPTNVANLLGIERVEVLQQRLSALLGVPVRIVPDESLCSIRITPRAGKSQPPMSSEHRAWLSRFLHHAMNNGNSNASAPNEKVPRPPNKFMLYRQYHHRSVTAANPGVPNTQISRIIANMWRNESQAVRDRFQVYAEMKKEQHAIDFPGYQYSPRRPNQIQRRAPRAPTLLPAGLIAFVRGTPSGDAVLATAVNGTITVTNQVIDCLAQHGLIYGPNGLAPIRYPPALDSVSELIENVISRNPYQPLSSPLDGTEFGPDFPESEVAALSLL